MENAWTSKIFKQSNQSKKPKTFHEIMNVDTSRDDISHFLGYLLLNYDFTSYSVYVVLDIRLTLSDVLIIFHPREFSLNSFFTRS